MNSPTPPLLTVTDLACQRGERLLFRRLNVRLTAGQLLRVEGSNGIGKTSLLRLLCGLTEPEVGQIAWQGEAISRSREAFHAALLYLGHAVALHDLLTPLENLQFLARGASQSQCLEALARMGLSAQFDLPCRVLSQGQRRRVGLARLFLGSAQTLWILDEPFAALDVAAVAQLAQTMDAHCAQGGAVIFTSHQEVSFATALSTLDMGGFAV